MTVQIKLGAQPADDTLNDQDPRIKQIQYGILSTKGRLRTDYAFRNNAVKHVKYMIDHNRCNRYPPDIVYVMLSHTSPTFAMIFNKL